MSPLPELILLNALHSCNQGHMHPGWTMVGSVTASYYHHTLLFLTPVIHLLKISPSQPLLRAYLYLILHPLCTLSLSVSLSTTPSPIPTHSRRLSVSLLLQSLSRWLRSPLVNSLFSQLSPLSAHSLHLSCVPSLHLNWCSSSFCLSLSHYLPL